MPRTRTSSSPAERIAVIGAGMAGIACARTLERAGHDVILIERQDRAGGRMATHDSPFGAFDHGAQYFTVRDARFAQALTTVPGLCKAWSASTVRVLDAHGRVAAASPPAPEPHWIPAPTMDALAQAWIAPLKAAGRVKLGTRVSALTAQRDGRWTLQLNADAAPAADKPEPLSDVHRVVLAMPAPQAAALLHGVQGHSGAQAMAERLDGVTIAPCWTLLLAYPQAMQPGLGSLGPQWNAAHSTHHRVAWLARESSKPGREPIERWTVQAAPDWSSEHAADDPMRAQAKLMRAFTEITGIRVEPAWTAVHRWPWARTTHALGESHALDADSGLAACGDWCLGHRVEDAFVSGLELALAIVGRR